MLNDADQFPLHAAPDAWKGLASKYVINSDKEALWHDVSIPARRGWLLRLPHYFWSRPVKKTGQQLSNLQIDATKRVLHAESASRLASSRSFARLRKGSLVNAAKAQRRQARCKRTRLGSDMSSDDASDFELVKRNSISTKPSTHVSNF